MMAHYLLFIGGTRETIFVWIVVIYAKWVVTPPQLANDMSALYRAPRVNDNQNEVYALSGNLRAIISTAYVFTTWFITRYGYHLSIYLLIERTINFAFGTFNLFNLLKPGIKVYRTSFEVSQITDIIACTMHMPTVIQWYLTLFILASVAAIPFYWFLFAINPGTNIHMWVYLIIPIGLICVAIWSWSKYYLDTYVQIDKI